MTPHASDIAGFGLACAVASPLALGAVCALLAEWLLGSSPAGCARCSGWGRLVLCDLPGRWQDHRLCPECCLAALVEANQPRGRR